MVCKPKFHVQDPRCLHIGGCSAIRSLEHSVTLAVRSLVFCLQLWPSGVGACVLPFDQKVIYQLKPKIHQCACQPLRLQADHLCTQQKPKAAAVCPYNDAMLHGRPECLTSVDQKLMLRDHRKDIVFVDGRNARVQEAGRCQLPTGWGRHAWPLAPPAGCSRCARPCSIMISNHFSASQRPDI